MPAASPADLCSLLQFTSHQIVIKGNNQHEQVNDYDDNVDDIIQSLLIILIADRQMQITR